MRTYKRLFPGIECAECGFTELGVGRVLFYNKFDQLHNENGPSAIFANGTKFYYLCGQRVDPEALIYELNK